MAEKQYNLSNAFAYLTKYGYTSASRYWVSFTKLNPALQAIPSFNMDGQARMKISCENVDLPVKNITTDDLRIGKHLRKTALGYTLDPIKLTYRCSNDMLEKIFFDKWLDLVCDPITGLVAYPDVYCADINIEILDGNGEPVYAVKLIDAYPIAVNASSLAFQSASEILKVDVQIVYTRFETQQMGLFGQATQAMDSVQRRGQPVQTNIPEFMQAALLPNGVNSKLPTFNIFGADARVALTDLGIPLNNPAYEWNSYLSSPTAWDTQNPQEALSKVAAAKTEILSPAVQSAISNNGSVSAPNVTSATNILTGQADGVAGALQGLTAGF